MLFHDSVFIISKNQTKFLISDDPKKNKRKNESFIYYLSKLIINCVLIKLKVMDELHT